MSLTNLWRWIAGAFGKADFINHRGTSTGGVDFPLTLISILSLPKSLNEYVRSKYVERFTVPFSYSDGAHLRLKTIAHQLSMQACYKLL